MIIAFFITIFVIGVFILINSVDLGNNEMSRIMNNHGGSMDTSTYLINLEQSITQYRFMGSILSILGGLGMIKNIKN